MERHRKAFALLLALALVGQGWASVRPVAVPAQVASGDEMPCHAPQPAPPSCCDPATSCPDMLHCVAGAALVPAALVIASPSRPDPAPRAALVLHASERPPTAFRPPIVLSA